MQHAAPLIMRLIGGAFVVAIGIVGYSFVASKNPPYVTAVVHRVDVTQEVLATGNVAALKDIDLQFQNAGRITSVNVETGNRVEAGQVLTSLDTSVLQAQREQAFSALDVQKAQLASLHEGTRPEQIAVTQAQIASDQTAVSQAEQSVVDAIQTAYTVSDNVVKNTVDQFFNNPQINPKIAFTVISQQLENTVESDRANIGLTLATWQQAVAALVAQSDLAGAENLAQNNLHTVAALLADANVALNSSVTSAQVNVAELNTWTTNVATARTTIDTTISALTTAVTARKNATATLDRDKKTLALQQAGSTSSTIAAQDAQVAAAQANVSVLNAQIAQMRIVAPIAGTITSINVEIGETVTPGEIAVSMIPESKLQINVNLSEDNVADARAGDPARITLDAFGGGAIGHGTVVKIDPAQTIIGGAVYYKTTVNFDQPDPRVKPGMTANIWIQTGTASSTLVVPASALSTEASGTFVQVLENGTLRKQSVAVGLKGQDGLVQILSGLQEGEAVVTGKQ